MDNSTQIDKILSLVRTKSEAGEVLISLENFMGAFFSSKEQSDLKAYFYRLSKTLADALSDTFAKEPITEANRDKIETLVKQLQEALKTCTVLTMTIAFRSDEETITVFSSWAKENVGINTVLEIQVDKTIGGGALIVVNGKYKDYSIKKKLGGIFQIQREEITALLGNT